MIEITEHYRERYKERVSKSSKNMQLIANRAFRFGKGVETVKDVYIRKYLQEREQVGEGICKIYRGFVWWFVENRIITVYPLSGGWKKIGGTR